VRSKPVPSDRYFGILNKYSGRLVTHGRNSPRLYVDVGPAASLAAKYGENYVAVELELIPARENAKK
jgi:hypothetical protein